MPKQSDTPPRLRTVSQLCAELGGVLSQPAIRDHIWRSVERERSDGTVLPANGLAPAIFKIGRKVLIDLDAYLDWLEDHRLAPRVDVNVHRSEVAHG